MCLRTTFLCLKHEIAHMIDHGGGAIADVTSLAGMLHNGFGGAGYGAGKAAVIRLTKFAAVSYADRGIRVNCIALEPAVAFACRHASPCRHAGLPKEGHEGPILAPSSD